MTSRTQLQKQIHTQKKSKTRQQQQKKTKPSMQASPTVD